MNNYSIFKKHRNAEVIAQGLDKIPSDWALTPVREKRPYRKKWQYEPPISHETIRKGITDGHQLISQKTEKPYIAFDSGFGLRLGDISGGLIAIDIDGLSASPLLFAIAGGKLPKTVSWTSGKEGRYQILFQVPEEWQNRLSQFTRAVITEWNGLRTAQDEEGKPSELLEIRYNKCQSVLPPSYHPTTGGYDWINSPEECEVAIAPDWLLELVISCADKEKTKKAEKEQKLLELKGKKSKRKSNGFIKDNSNSLIEAVEKATERLDYTEVFTEINHNWKARGEKVVGDCPRHSSESGTAFQVNIETLEWYCHGCEVGGHVVNYLDFARGGTGKPTGKAFIELGKEVCDRAGIDFPKPESQSSFSLNCNSEKEVGEETYSKTNIKQEFEKTLKKAQDFILWAQGKQENLEKKKDIYVKPATNDNDKEKTYESYKSGTLPKSSDHTIKFRKEQRKQAYSEAYANGAKIVLDRTQTGEGKSHNASKLKPSNFDFGVDEEGNPQNGQVVFFLSEPDKGAVQFDEDWVRLAKITTENCQNAASRKALAKKGLGHSTGVGKSDSNPICKSCPALKACRESGFKREMKDSLAHSKVFGHPNGFPRTENQRTIAVYDEFRALIPPTMQNEIELHQIVQTFVRLEKEDKLLYQTLLPIKGKIEAYLSGEKSIPQYGIDLATLKAEIGEYEATIIDRIRNWELIWEKEDKEKIKSDSTPDEIEEKVMESWLGDFISIINGSINGSIRLGRRKGEIRPTLIISQRNEEKIAQVKSFDMAILLDATLTKEELVFEYGFDANEILEIEQETTPTPKFEIKQYTNAGLNTSQRSEAGMERKKLIASHLKETHPDLGVIDYSKFAEADELQHHRSGEAGARGSNRFKDRSAVLSLGVPYIAVNAVVDEYQSITGEIVADAKSDANFRAYYDRKVEKEMIQVIGRARANLRPKEKVTFYLLTDLDCSFLGKLGVKVTSEPIWNLVSELKPSWMQAIEGVSQFFGSLAYQGAELSKAKLKDVASFLNMTEANLSRMLRRLGGWYELRRKINTLFKTIREDVNFLTQDWDITAILQTELGKIYGLNLSQSPELIAEAIAEYGWEKFETYINASHPTEKGELLASLLSLIFNLDHSLMGIRQSERNTLEEVSAFLKSRSDPRGLRREKAS